ncbi:hypothetical protein LWI28_018617 [Acer negundo]|uniref:Uncharacterized protein n=1 Tax=Acer negundo TaxID=4023 RepID=A0AAD5IM95_ACENE|nr:hypothetical protein LWI28_018617 [Acer negundo]
MAPPPPHIVSIAVDGVGVRYFCVKPYRHQPPPSTSTHRQIDLPLCRQLPPPSAKPRPLPPKEKEKRRSTAGRDVSGDAFTGLPNLFKNLFLSILAMIIQLLSALPPPLAIPVDHEAAMEHHPGPEPDAALLANKENLNWDVRMICFCLPPAVAIALQFLNTGQSHELPLAFHFLSCLANSSLLNFLK